jgi:probable F420-dependent oxidoreductase
MPLKIDVMLSNSVVDAAERARAIEALGVDGVFSFENAHDVFFPLVAAAPVCSLDLMTNVAMAFPRSPVHMAHAAYDLHWLSQGRFRLGLGSQVRAHVEKRFGARFGAPVAHMRESVEATKAILQAWQDGTRVEYRGEYTTHTLMTPAFTPKPNPYGMPKVLVGALGPKMNQMAAEVADGILVMPFNSDRHMRERTWPAIEAGMRAAGRTRADLEVSAEVLIGVGRTDEELERARGVRTTLAFYGSTPAYRPVLDVEGWGDRQPELNARSKRGEWGEMMTLVTDEMVDTLAVYGTPDAVAAEIVRRYGDCDRVCAYFPGYRAGDDLVADVVAALRAVSR